MLTRSVSTKNVGAESADADVDAGADAGVDSADVGETSPSSHPKQVENLIDDSRNPFDEALDELALEFLR